MDTIFFSSEKNKNCFQHVFESYPSDQESKNTSSRVLIDQQEVALLKKLIAGSNDQTAFVRLYRIYFSPLLQFAVSFVKSRPVAEEIVSDVFFQLWLKREKLEEIAQLHVYLYTCIRNHCINSLMKQKREMVYYLDEQSLSIPSAAADPEHLYISSELERQIDTIIKKLPPKCRMIFKLIREDGLKYREVAEVLEISVKTVEAQMGIAMKKIHNAIRPDMPAKRSSGLNRPK
jgi:RNA polymerase sigma-70 factor (family 1)